MNMSPYLNVAAVHAFIQFWYRLKMSSIMFILQIQRQLLVTAHAMTMLVIWVMEDAKKILEKVLFVMSMRRQLVQTL